MEKHSLDPTFSQNVNAPKPFIFRSLALSRTIPSEIGFMKCLWCIIDVSELLVFFVREADFVEKSATTHCYKMCCALLTFPPNFD